MLVRVTLPQPCLFRVTIENRPQRKFTPNLRTKTDLSVGLRPSYTGRRFLLGAWHSLENPCCKQGDLTSVIRCLSVFVNHFSTRSVSIFT